MSEKKETKHTPIEASGSAAAKDMHSDLFFAAVEVTRMPMVVTDPHLPDNPIIFANPAFLEMTGYAEHEIVGRNCRFLQGPETKPEKIAEIRTSIAERKEMAIEVLNYKKDGSSFWNALFISPIRNRAGEIVYFFASQLDVSQRHLAEMRLHRSEKMEALGQLTGGIAHDFNNMLQITTGSLEIIKNTVEKLAPDDKNKTLIGKINRHIAIIESTNVKQSQLTQNLLAFSRKQRLESQSINLNGKVADLSEIAKRVLGDHIKLKVQLATDLANTQLDPAKAENALLNILINARDAMPDGGMILVETRNQIIDETDVIGFGLPAGRYVVVEVTDNGIGMSPEIRDRVIEPFFTTKDEGKGTGMGLAQVDGFVKQSGGFLKIYSELAHGTTVRLSFPATDMPLVVNQASTLQNYNPRGVEHILIVDDREPVAEIARSTLENLGYRTEMVFSSVAALQMLQEGLRPDLLFSDIVMPSISGLELARTVSKSFPDIKILLTTGFADAALEVSAHGKNEFEIISKPYQGRDLAQRVRRILDGPTGV